MEVKKFNNYTRLKSRKASSILVMLLHELQMICLSSIPWNIFEITVCLCMLKVTLLE